MLVETSYVCLILRHVALSNASILLLLIMWHLHGHREWFTPGIQELALQVVLLNNTTDQRSVTCGVTFLSFNTSELSEMCLYLLWKISMLGALWE